MANELNAPLGISNTGLTVVGRVRASGGVQEGSDATMTETGINGFYSGSFALGAVRLRKSSNMCVVQVFATYCVV